MRQRDQGSGINRRSLMLGSGAAAVLTPSCSLSRPPASLASPSQAAEANSIFALWYDLPSEARESHLEWLSNSYLPHLASNPKHLFVAHYKVVGGSPAFQQGSQTMARFAAEGLPKGTQYLLLVGARTSATFFEASSFWRLEQQHSPTGSRAAERQGARPAVFIQEYSINGPEAAAFKGAAPGPVIQMGTFVLGSPEGDFSMGDFYVHHRGPAMASMPGCIRMRKLVATAGWGKHGVIYEFSSEAERIEHFEAAEFEDHSRRGRFVSSVSRTIHLPGSPSVGVRTWPI